MSLKQKSIPDRLAVAGGHVCIWVAAAISATFLHIYLRQTTDNQALRQAFLLLSAIFPVALVSTAHLFWVNVIALVMTAPQKDKSRRQAARRARVRSVLLVLVCGAGFGVLTWFAARNGIHVVKSNRMEENVEKAETDPAVVALDKQIESVQAAVADKRKARNLAMAQARLFLETANPRNSALSARRAEAIGRELARYERDLQGLQGKREALRQTLLAKMNNQRRLADVMVGGLPEIIAFLLMAAVTWRSARIKRDERRRAEAERRRKAAEKLALEIEEQKKFQHPDLPVNRGLVMFANTPPVLLKIQKYRQAFLWFLVLKGYWNPEDRLLAKIRAVTGVNTSATGQETNKARKWMRAKSQDEIAAEADRRFATMAKIAKEYGLEMLNDNGKPGVPVAVMGRE